MDSILAEADIILKAFASKGENNSEFVRKKLDDLSNRKRRIDADIVQLEVDIQNTAANAFNAQEIIIMLRNVRSLLKELPVFRQAKGTREPRHPQGSTDS